ncbi:MAG: ABC transporter permease, partial [Planctomycetota bacterium]
MNFAGIAPLLAQVDDETLARVSASNEWVVTSAVVAAIVAGLFAFSKLTRAGVIASATTKEAVRQPLFLLLLGLAAVLLIVNTVLPFFSLGDDIKMFKDCGLATILVCGLLLATWTAGTSVADEIDGKTAMTLLSKPIDRRQFILGKYVGIAQATLLLTAILSVLFLFLIYYKVGYDAKESSQSVPDWFVPTTTAAVFGEGSFLTGLLSEKIWWFSPQRLAETLQILPGLLLICCETCVLAAIAVAIATRLPTILNITICFAIFVIGHLSPVLVLVPAETQAFEVVRFVAGRVATILPGLEWFNVQDSVA